jgi:hypothetical protein
MAQIQSGATSDLLTVDSVSKAARVTFYDTRGNAVAQKATYAACTTAKTAVAAGTTTPYAALYGSGTKTIRVQRIVVCATIATTNAYVDLVVAKRTAAISGGTKTDLTQVALDSNNSAGTANIAGIYTAAPTAGTGGGIIAAQLQFVPITGTAALCPAVFDFDWRFRDESEAPVLRGTAQGVEVSFGTSIATNQPTLTVMFLWTEE